jgi:hypothetical protein
MRCHFKHKTYIYKAHILFFALLCTITSCTREDNISATLDRAEMLMQEQPDSALVLLKGIDADGLKTEVQKARYALLYTQALEKNDLPIPGDSLINTAVRYYERGDNAHYKALAYLYRGVAYKQMDSIALAFNSYARAAEEVDRKRDGYTYGLTQSYMGVLYEEQRRYKEAILLYKNAHKIFNDIGYQRNENYILGKLGDLFYYSNRADSAAHYYMAAKEMAAARCDSNYVYIIDVSMVTLLQEQKKYAEAKTLLLQTIHQYKGGIIPEDCYSDLAYSYLGLQQLDSARYYMQLALQAPAVSTETHTWMLSAMREIARLEGNPAEALDFQMRYTRSRDSVSKVINNQDIKVIEANYQREEEAHEKSRYKHRNTLLLVLIPLIILLSAGLFLWKYKQWKKRAALQVHETRAAMKEEFAPIQQAMDESINLRWDVTRFLEQYHKIQTGDNEKAFERVVIGIAKTHYPGFTHWLGTYCPGLKESDMALACLLYTPIPIKELSDAYCISQNAAYTRCSRLYKKLGIEVARGRTPAFREIIIRMYQQTQVSM